MESTIYNTAIAGMGFLAGVLTWSAYLAVTLGAVLLLRAFRLRGLAIVRIN